MSYNSHWYKTRSGENFCIRSALVDRAVTVIRNARFCAAVGDDDIAADYRAEYAVLRRTYLRLWREEFATLAPFEAVASWRNVLTVVTRSRS